MAWMPGEKVVRTFLRGSTVMLFMWLSERFRLSTPPEYPLSVVPNFFSRQFIRIGLYVENWENWLVEHGACGVLVSALVGEVAASFGARRVFICAAGWSHTDLFLFPLEAFAPIWMGAGRAPSNLKFLFGRIFD